MAGSLRDRLLGRAAPGITTIRPTPNENGKAPPAPEVLRRATQTPEPAGMVSPPASENSSYWFTQLDPLCQ